MALPKKRGNFCSLAVFLVVLAASMCANELRGAPDTLAAAGLEDRLEQSCGWRLTKRYHLDWIREPLFQSSRLV
eukprot:scaffold1828_cov169-Amphora_coffeaeformis.AAC.1